MGRAVTADDVQLVCPGCHEPAAGVLPVEWPDRAGRCWLTHTTQTRVQAELSKAELSARDAGDDPDDRVTAAEWKAAHQAAVSEDERHREITEDDVDRHEQDDRVVEPVDEAGEIDRRDLCEVAAAEPAAVLEDVVRVPDADETAHSVDHAGRVLDEILYRDAADVAEEVDHRAEELNRWHGDDQEAAVEYETAGWSAGDE